MHAKHNNQSQILIIPNYHLQPDFAFFGYVARLVYNSQERATNMMSSKDNQITFELITHSICKQGLCSRPQLLAAVWQATKRVITNNWTQGKDSLLSNLFRAKGVRELNKFSFILEPTEVLLSDCGLKYRAQPTESTQVSLVSQNSLYKNLPTPADREYFKSDKQLTLRFFYLIIGKLKEILKSYRNIEIFLDHFGIIRLSQKTYFFEPFKFNDKGSLSSPNLQKYKRFNSTKKQSNLSEKSGEQSHISNRFLESSEKKTFNIRKRPYFHQLVTDNQPPNTKIGGYLLGAGVDPLTYDYHYSKLADHPPELFSTEFKRQEHAQGRLPFVIDKFSRTKGSQITSLRVGNSIAVRIGSNYSPTAKNYYIDIVSKNIQSIAPEAKIKLQNPWQKSVQPASQIEQYNWILGHSTPNLQHRLTLRKEMYSRYCKYYRQIIPNDCVAPLKPESIQRIISMVRDRVRRLKRKDGSSIANTLINEVNRDYYLAYKRAVLNYILKDKDERVRIGISLPFHSLSEWGKPERKKIFSQNWGLTLAEAKKMLQLNHILYPECLNKIYEENQKLIDLEIFKKRKEGEYRPYNILYYIKRNTNQLNEAYNYLCENWVKRIAQIIQTQIALKQENYQKLKQFFNAIHILMSNKLKEVLYMNLTALSQQFSRFHSQPQTEAMNLLTVNMTEEGQSITFIDDIQKVFKIELVEIVEKIADVTRRIPRVENYLKLTTDLFVWGLDSKDALLQQTKQTVSLVIQQNFVQILALRQQLSRLELIFKLKQQVSSWCKQLGRVQGLEEKLLSVSQLEQEVLALCCYYKVNMVVVDCIQLKRKLMMHLKSLRRMLFDSVEERIKVRNAAVLARINHNIQLVSKGVSSTAQFVSLAQDIELIKSRELQQISKEIDSNSKEVLGLFALEGFGGSLEVLRSTYVCRQSFEELHRQLFRNQRRLAEERGQLQKRLREKISQFQTQTLSWLKQISLKIESFDMRKLYSEYLTVLSDYQSKVDSGKQVQKILNGQEEDLKWAGTIFAHAVQLQGIVQPNYQLWQLVAQFDGCLKEWKYLELSHFDVEASEHRISLIDNRITRLITKLKNFAGLKIVYDLQNDVKEFLVQQLPIIKIFSNPGLKDRHWSLFNKRLPLPGYDLKQLTFGRIKLLYQYQKNLKVLMSISNQAAKEFQIQNQKQEMFEYWSKLNFALYHASDENITFITQTFLEEQIQAIEHHLTKTVILKNSPFSKALVQMLGQWEGWLVNGRKILVGFRASQEKFMVVRSIFKMEEIAKILPIESTEYDSIENIWKSVIKKILEQPKVTQFFKSQKMPQIIQEIGRKADFIRNSFNTYLNLKRLQFNRLYFLPEKTVLSIIQRLASDRLQQAYSLTLRTCFNGLSSLVRDDSSTFRVSSCLDSMDLSCQTMHSKRGKAKFFEELVILDKNMRENIRKQIRVISSLEGKWEEAVDGSTLTALLAVIELRFSKAIENHNCIQTGRQQTLDSISRLSQQIKQRPSLKYENLLLKLQNLLERIDNLRHLPSFSPDSILRFQWIDNELVISSTGTSIKYDNQYCGDEVTCFLPTQSERLIWHLSFSICKRVGTLCKDSPILREIALFSGQYYARIDHPLHSTESNFESCVMGSISTGYWIHFIDEHLKLSADCLALLFHTLEEKRTRGQAQQSLLTFRNCELNVNYNTCLIVSLDTARPPLHNGILTAIRSVTLYKPDLEKIKKAIKQCAEREQIKMYLFTLKQNCEGIHANAILKEISQISNCQAIKYLRNKLWKQLSSQQKLLFTQLFQQSVLNDQFQAKTWQNHIKRKVEELDSALNCYDVVLVAGRLNGKTTAISKILSERNAEALFNQSRGVNLNFIEEGVSQLRALDYLQKAREKLLKNAEDMIIYLDGQAQANYTLVLREFLHLHGLSAEYSKPLKIVVQSYSLDSLDPSSLASFGLVSYSQTTLELISTYQYETNKLILEQQDRASVLQLQSSFENLLTFTCKMQRRIFNHSRPILTRRFFRYFSIYLSHLNSKEVERMCEFDRENYIFNSLAYCVFWAFSGALRNIQTEALKKYMKELFADKLDMPGEFQQVYLNEENEWVFWENIKEDFVSEKQNVPFYQIWVPTSNSTKMLTMTIKLLEKGDSIILCGGQSGRTSLLSQISSFELSYNTFLYDCHPKSSIDHLNNLTRGKILYGDSQKNLILVDDLHLPSEKTSDVLRTYLEHGYCPSPSLLGKLNENIFKPLVMASCQNQDELSTSFFRFSQKAIPLQMDRLGEIELQSIFRAYFNALFSNSELQSSVLKLQNVVINYFMHTSKVFPSLSISNLRLLMQSLCRYNLNRGQASVIHHLLAESHFILQAKLPHQEITHFFRHISHYYGKLLSIQLKNHSQLRETVDSFIYDIRSAKDGERKDSVEDLTLWMSEVLNEKGNQYYICEFQAKIIQRIVWSLRGTTSHLILVSNSRYGCTSLAKIAGWLMKIQVLDLQALGVNGLLEQVVKVLKTGGKVDESLSVLTHQLIKSRPELLKLVNSLLFSPEFHQCFGQILMEQIIKSFNSQKKFLKKNVKKSELIKKIREKFNSIFHFCLSLNRQTLQKLLSQYPKFLHLRIIEIDQWPIQAVKIASKKFLTPQNYSVLNIILEIEEEIKLNWQNFSGKNSKNILQILYTFDRMCKFMEMKAKSQQENTELWSKRIKISQQKLINLQKQKKVFESEHSEYFQKNSSFTENIRKAVRDAEETSKRLFQAKSHLEQCKVECDNIKKVFEREQNEIHIKYAQQVQSMKQMLLLQIDELKTNKQLEEIALAYGFPLDNVDSQITQFLLQLEKDYFYKLSKIDCQNLGSITSLYLKFQNEMADICSKQNLLSSKFKLYEQQQKQVYEQSKRIKQLQDDISRLKEDEAQLKQNQQSTLKTYNQLNDKIAQFQSINSILLKFEHILRSKNEMALPVPLNINGCALLAAYALSYSLFLHPEEIATFLKMVCEKIQRNGLSFSLRDLVSIFSPEQQFKLLHEYEVKTAQVLNLIALESCSIGFACIGRVQQVKDWVNRIADKKQVIFPKQGEQIRDLLQRDQIVLVPNPDSSVLEKLLPLLRRSFQLRNNTKTFTVDDEEVTIHENSRVVLIYGDQKGIPEELLNQVYILRIHRDPQDRILDFLESQLRKEGAVADRKAVVLEYLKGSREIGMMDEKLHSIIMKMKKENIVSQIIYKRIEEEGESKLQNQRKIDNYKLTLNAIAKIMSQYRPLARDISQVYSRHKQCIQYNEFQFVLGSIANYFQLQTLKELPLLAAEIFQQLIGETHFRANPSIKPSQAQGFIMRLLSSSTITVKCPEISLATRFIMEKMMKEKVGIFQLSPENLSVNTLKQNKSFCVKISRDSQWKNILNVIQLLGENKAITIIFITLDRIRIPPEVQTSFPTLTIQNLGRMALQGIPAFKTKKERSLYQQSLQYRACIAEATPERAQKMRCLLDLQ